MPWRHEATLARPAPEWERIEARAVRQGDRITLTKHGHPRIVQEVEGDGAIRLDGGSRINLPKAMRLWRQVPDWGGYQ